MSDYFPTNQNSTRWLTEEVFKLIDFVQRDEAIYNPRHKYYFCRPYVENFWRQVDQKLDKNPGASLAKWTNLRISFRREFTNYLEEQVPPCWSYFDRMFFLHPYLRKKQQAMKPGESTLQETLSQINELSSRLERRAIKELTRPTSAESGQHNAKDLQNENSNAINGQQPTLSDHYFDYYDETEHNNSELDEIIDDDQHCEVTASYPQIILETSANNKIKSECEDEIQDDEYEKMLENRHDVNDDVDRINDLPIRSTVGNTPTISARLGKRAHQQMRLEHLNRLQTRSYHEDLRAKRSRSPERSLVNSQPVAGCSTSHSQRLSCATTTTTNVSFVRPTVTKTTDAPIGTDITTTSTMSTPSISSSTAQIYATQQQIRQYPYYGNFSSRVDGPSAANSSSTSLNITSSSNANGNNTNTHSPTLMNATSTPHLELCDCKTDPDAMFLMSLLPDIQKLNGRDRGKIKIAFQNILQDYLYPD